MPDLTTYTWRQLAPATHPAVNEEFGFCWAGTKAVLFGGTGLPGTLNQTWVLEGEEWRQLSPATPPSARTLTSLAWDGTRVLLFGGITALGDLNNETWSLDLGTEEWTQLAPAHTPAIDTLYGFGTNILVWDGSRFLAQVQKSGLVAPETWQFAAGDWTNVAPANQPTQAPTDSRCFPALTYDGSGTVTMFGGQAGSGNVPITDPVKGATWDFTAGDWSLNVVGSDPNVHPDSSLSGNPGYTRFRCPIASTGAEILLFGGHIYDLGFVGTLATDDTWMLDVTGWTELPQSIHPPSRYSHGLVWDDLNDRFILHAGYREVFSSATYYTDTWVFEGAPVPPPPSTVSASISHVFGAN